MFFDTLKTVDCQGILTIDERVIGIMKACNMKEKPPIIFFRMDCPEKWVPSNQKTLNQEGKLNWE